MGRGALLAGEDDDVEMGGGVLGGGEVEQRLESAGSGVKEIPLQSKSTKSRNRPPSRFWKTLSHQSILPSHDGPAWRALYPLRVLIRYAPFRLSGSNFDWWRSLHCDVWREHV
jgi:hypothetical protein